MKNEVTEGMLRRMEQEAIHEMLHYDDRDIKRGIKDMVKKAAGRYVPPKDMIFWPGAMLANSLTEWGKESEKRKAVPALKEYFDRWIGAGMPLYFVDDVLAGVSLIDLYLDTKEEKYKAGADRMAAYLYRLEEMEADETGSIPYRPFHGNQHIYADGAGMMGSFLIKYGAVFHSAHGIESGWRQMRNMLLFGMDEKTGLPYHGFQYENKIKYGIIGWGRAVGWLLMGLSRGLCCIRGSLREEDGQEKREKEWESACRTAYGEMEASYRRLMETAGAYQKENGAFPWQLGAEEGPEDSSATAMIAYAAAMEAQRKDKQTQWEIGRRLAEQAAGYLAGQEKDGRIYSCLAECKGFSEYPQYYGAYPWSLGPGLGVLRWMREKDSAS